ncbi:MAG: alanine--tRNA ligase [Candidatus Aenigmatarchaeota archaeon]
MVTKKELIEKLNKNPERYWKVKLFDEVGFKRKKCINCGKFFWTLTEQEKCNDSTCRPYDFIGNPPTNKRLGFFETWNEIEKFFVKRGHTSIKPYPVVCRWFPLYFTIAGVVDFYRISDGKLEFEFPANPIILPQICLRFNDIANTGVNARSYTCFGMIQQSSLYDGREGYWKDECMEIDFDLLVKVFGINPEEIVFIEDAWLGPSAFGSSLEYHVRGLELGNAVFTEFLGTPDNYEEMKEKVIDMGAGWERFTWITQGTPTSYDCVFGSVLKKLKKECDVEYDEEFFLNYSKFSGVLNLDEVKSLKEERVRIAEMLNVSIEELEKKVATMEALYSIADHSRALVFAISDGGLPSNVGGGYNLRVILRRALNFINKFKWNIKLQDVAIWHIDYLKKIFPELKNQKEEILKILDVEEKRYNQAKERSRRIVESLSGKKITEEDLITLYESEGITPDQLGLETPNDFYVKITERHMKPKEEERKIKLDVSKLPPTKILYYDQIYEFDAMVLGVFGDYVVLDQTAFYPRSGGQEPDSGTINGFKVIDVEKIGSVIIHKLENHNLKTNQKVSCVLDKERRVILSKHHVATHLINAASRKILGKHVWQHSAFKDIDGARLDITHYESLTQEQVERIENLANDFVRMALPINTEILPRGEAEKKYGFTIYQGGAFPEKTLRIVKIGDVDIEACGGTHHMLENTKDIGCVIIQRTKRIQDGVVRIEFVAGDVALKYLKEKEKILIDVANFLNVKEEDVPKEVEKIFKRWKELRKNIKKLKVVK